MKRILQIIALLLISLNLFAQAPQKMSYQAVIRNASNNLVTNAPVKMRISILQGNNPGTSVYSELHSATTNANGLVSIEIGEGTNKTGTFSAINWGNGTYFLRTETDPTNGTNYTITGTSQLLSVPYALYAGNVVNNGGKPVIYLTGNITNAQAQTKIASEYGINTHEIRIEECTALTSIDLSVVKEVADIRIENNQNLQSINLSSLETCSSIDFRNCPKLISINLNSLLQLGGFIYIQDLNSLIDLNFNSLSIVGKLEISNNLSLSSVSFPVLTKLNDFGVYDNPKLSNFSMPNFSTINGFGFSLRNNKISSSQINLLLNRLVSISPILTDKFFSFESQNPPAPPTGQGLTDKATLISRGNTVTTD